MSKENNLKELAERIIESSPPEWKSYLREIYSASQKSAYDIMLCLEKAADAIDEQKQEQQREDSQEKL